MSLLDEIKQKSKANFPAGRADIEQLRSLGAPEEVLNFFLDSEPASCVEISSVRLWPISELLVENRDAAPGLYAQPCGYVVFATTIYGDAFCFDTRATTSNGIAPVLLIAHDLEPENDVMKCEDLAKLAKPIAPSLESFLQAFVLEALDIDPLYPPFDSGKFGDLSHS